MPSAPAGPRLAVRFPAVDGGAPDQDAEWCEVTEADAPPRRIRFHDYADIYRVPGLYETIFHEHLGCTSPETVIGLLAAELERAGVAPSTLRGIDVGAGNGLVGERLRALGVSALVGVDLLDEAAAAAERDRPGVYDDYLACDLTALTAKGRARLTAIEPNLLTTVAALGFGDIPTEAFTAAFDLVADGGWVAFNLKAEFLDDTDPSGFAALVQGMLADGVLEERTRLRYPHRLSMTGAVLEYVALVGVKRRGLRAGRFRRA